MNRYTEARFLNGIEPYMQSLQKQEIVGKKSILDIGCGPGHWTFAAAKLNLDASVVGIDINETALDFASKYKKKNAIENCEFLRESYEGLLEVFQPESFDVIICNSVIQYIDTRKAFYIISNLLKKGGILLMFYNHDRGYYLQRQLLRQIKNLNIAGIIYGMLLLSGVNIPTKIRGKQREHFVNMRYLKKISKEAGINTTKIKTLPKLEYKDRFMGFAYVFSCKGIKI